MLHILFILAAIPLAIIGLVIVALPVLGVLSVLAKVVGWAASGPDLQTLIKNAPRRQNR